MKRDLLWIGSYVDAETESRLIHSIQYKKPSTSLSQRNILEGIERVSGRSFDCIGAVVMTGFPYDRHLFVPAISFPRADGKSGRLAGFLNVLYLNKEFTSTQLGKLTKEWINEHRDSAGVDVFIYEVRSACLKAAALVKKRIPNTRIHLIVPDLPCYMDLKMGRIKRILKGLDWKRIQHYLPVVDTFILYAAAMANYMGIEERPWLLMEGSICADAQLCKGANGDANKTNSKCTVMYSGSINERFGLMNLVEAMKRLDDRYELWITGSGQDAKMVEAAAAQTENVHYYGFLADQNDVMRMQTEATALINMRDPQEDASNYCFPSKLFEYMLTGKPVLSCRLGGIPDEYFDYLVEMKSIAPEDIAEAIRMVSTLDADRCGAEGRDFVIREKNNLKQAQRITRFVWGDGALLG